jgi:DNA-binding SARP family transcriptional activator
MAATAEGRRSMDSHIELVLLRGFDVIQEKKSLRVPLGAQRLLALLALESTSIHRNTASDRLWPDSTRSRSAANLRSALSQCRQTLGSSVIESEGSRLHLAPRVKVDFKEALNHARSIGRQDVVLEVDLEMIIDALSGALLSDWDEEWLIPERDRWDQVRLHTLEAVARYATSKRQYLRALEAGFAAIAIEPVRETAHRTIIEAYIAEGNAGCALQHYQKYRGLVRRELGVNPSREMLRLVHPLTAS